MSEFVIKGIFDSVQVNAQLDRMYYEIGQAMPALAINTVMCLTGRAAAELQDAPPQDCNQIVFIVNDVPLYGFVQSGLPKIMPNKGVLTFKERTIFYMDGFVLEVWYQVAALNIVLRSGVYLQNIDDINEILL